MTEPCWLKTSYDYLEIGGGVMVFDTCLVSIEMLELAIKLERERGKQEKEVDRRLDAVADVSAGLTVDSSGHGDPPHLGREQEDSR